MSADVITPILACAPCPSKDGLEFTAMPRREGRAFLAAAVVTMIFRLYDPLGAASDGSSRRTRMPENGILFGCPSSVEMFNAMALRLIASRLMALCLFWSRRAITVIDRFFRLEQLG